MKRIYEQIAQCDIFIYLMSQSSVKSKYCKNELDEAIRLGKSIIPIQVASSVRIPSLIADNYQVLNMVQGVSKESLVELFGAITRKIWNLR